MILVARSPSRAPSGASLLRPAERLLAALMLAVGAAFAATAWTLGQSVAWGEVARVLAPGSFLMALGVYARARTTMGRLATFVFAAGFYVNFGNLAALCIYLRFPLGSASIDPLLLRVDAHLGYDWAAWVRGVAATPPLGLALRLVYQSSLWQLLLVMTALASLRRERDLDRFMLVGAIGLVITAAVWWVAPSLGPAVLHAPAPEVEAAARLAVDAAYAAELRRLAAHGNDVLGPARIVGAIAFPSYHIFMACLVVAFARGTPLLAPAMALNLAMIPATLVQGGHHATDLLGGVAVFALAMALTAGPRPWDPSRTAGAP